MPVEGLIPVEKCDLEMLPGERKPKLIHTFSLPPGELYKSGSTLHSMIVFALMIICYLAEIYFTGFGCTFFLLECHIDNQ